MQERGIPNMEVERALAKPDRAFLGAQGNPSAERAFRDERIRVVFSDRTEPAGVRRHVIPVM
jgi:hypothetical protein